MVKAFKKDPKQPSIIGFAVAKKVEKPQFSRQLKASVPPTKDLVVVRKGKDGFVFHYKEVEGEEGKFLCLMPFCLNKDYKFSRDSIEKHQRKVRNGLTCDKGACLNSKFESLALLVAHWVSVHKYKACGLCNNYAYDPKSKYAASNIGRHIATVHNRSRANIIYVPKKCKDCGLVMTSSTGQREHERKHERALYEGEMRCKLCKMPYKTINGIFHDYYCRKISQANKERIENALEDRSGLEISFSHIPENHPVQELR